MYLIKAYLPFQPTIVVLIYLLDGHSDMYCIGNFISNLNLIFGHPLHFKDTEEDLMRMPKQLNRIMGIRLG